MDMQEVNKMLGNAVGSLAEEKLMRGDKVKVPGGAIEMVQLVKPKQVVTYESARRGDWYHPTKVKKVK
jgi:hypothetical protein